MTENGVSYLGSAIALCRRHAGMTAEELAMKAGAGLTRSIIANLENGRKLDVSVSQLIAISFALGVSPADLMFDLRTPYRMLDVTGPPAPHAQMATWLVRQWWGGSLPLARSASLVDDEPLKATGAASISSESYSIAYYLQRRSELLLKLAAREKDEAKINEEPWGADESFKASTSLALRDIRAELHQVDGILRQSEVSLADPIHPDPF